MKKCRLLYRTGLALAPLLLVAIYMVKQESRELAARVAAKTTAVQKARTRQDILKAELATLTNPARIDRLARKYLGLQDVRAEQYIRLPKHARPSGLLPPDIFDKQQDDITATTPPQPKPQP